MNRNEVVEVMAKAVANGKGYEFNTQNSYDAYDQYYRDLVSPALTALESIMERDGLKLTSASAGDKMHKAGMDERAIQDQMNKTDNKIIDTSNIWKAMHDQAKCKLRGGE